MDTFVLEHRRAVLRTLIPINVVLGLGLIAVMLFGTFISITDPGAQAKIGLPLWVQIPFSAWLVWFFIRWIRDMVGTLHLHRERFEINDLGIKVTSVSGVRESYGWQDVTEASKPQAFIIRLRVRSRAKPLTLMTGKIFRGEKEFRELEELVRKRIHVPLHERWWI